MKTPKKIRRSGLVGGVPNGNTYVPAEGTGFFGAGRFFKDLLVVILVQYHPSGKTLGVFTIFTIFTAEETILTLPTG